ncbi:uncharacterized protein PHACADRAFT_261984 [Phanerochaete carnosa HHB-10118-sp]|uniref:Uncharacterized protein n=1 Tax=Phanerochaete carnosa (strain HHB-10118-sp) TaxID=650164 RepID=K5UPI3_PHACS|nr:uncharacterized protein PHACADRAFT_261984 [Phanerochaete carnosa HHB-10118-sp]EKM51691.1 hypothetical protein PHACADRAFT_261984 [Phanerochaete carnosa HHB-10118-sp]
MKKKSEEYAKLQDLLQDREFSTWSEFGKVLVAGIDDHAKLLNRTPSLAELTTVISRQEAKGFWPKMWQKGKTALRAAVRPAVVMIGAGFLSKTLLEGQGKLSVAEQLSMYTSLVDAMVQTRTSIFKGLKFVAWISTWLAKGLGWGLRKLLPSRALSWISAAKAFGEKAVNAVTGFAERLWAR